MHNEAKVKILNGATSTELQDLIERHLNLGFVIQGSQIELLDDNTLNAVYVFTRKY